MQRVFGDERQLLLRSICNVDGNVQHVLSEPEERGHERAKTARSQEDDDGGNRDDELNERASEEIQKLSEEPEDAMPSLMDEEVDCIDDPNDGRHVVPPVRREIIGSEVERVVTKEEKND